MIALQGGYLVRQGCQSSYHCLVGAIPLRVIWHDNVDVRGDVDRFAGSRLEAVFYGRCLLPMPRSVAVLLSLLPILLAVRAFLHLLFARS
jgi:hypothetical protein